MLSVASMAAGQCNYYLELGRSDYYLDGGEPPGQWRGQGSEELGLEGRVSKEHLRNLFEGYAPDRGRELVQLGRGHQPGWDLCFSAPKSVSVAWGVGERDVRESIQKAHDQAVDSTLRYLEDSASFTRRGHGGTELEKAGLCVATFQHGTSRAEDPQLHTHALVLNIASREDGTFGTLRSRDLYQHKMAAGAVYRAELAGNLRELGFELERDGSAFRISDVPKELEQEFSKRRAAIEQENPSNAKEAERAALSTREVKGHVARAELFEHWRSEADGRTFAPTTVSERAREGEQLGELASQALQALDERRGFFAERDLVREMATSLQDRGATAEAIREEARKALAREAIAVGRDGGYEHFATKAALEREAEVLRQAERLEAREQHAVADRNLDSVLSSRTTLNEEQKRALEQLAQPKDLVLLEGLAGTGKTFLLDAAREVWEREGYRVTGAAIAGKAALELQEGAGIPSSTVHSFLADPQLNEKTVLVIDEAGMVGANQLRQVLEHAYEAGAKVCLAGDYRQLPAIQEAAPFKHLCDRHGAAELREVTRQHELWESEALKQLADGDVRGALSQYELAGRLHQAKDGSGARAQLVEAWVSQRSEDLEKTLVLTGTNEERQDLNRRMQQERLRLEELERDRCAYRGEDRFFVGDRVAFTGRGVGYVNGDLGVIEQIQNRDELTVRLDREEGGRPVRCTLRLDDSLELGYALTTHKAQGQTVDRAFVLASPAMMSRELGYVQFSRARERTDLFIGQADAGEDLNALNRALEESSSRSLVIEEQQRLLALEQERGL